MARGTGRLARMDFLDSPAAWLVPIGLVLFVWIVWAWNALVRAANKVQEAFSGVDVQLKRRHDLVPNLVRTVKAYAAHEQEALEAVVDARGAAERASDLGERAARETTLAASMGKLFALVEAYPELKADANFRKLHHELVEIEDALQYARRYYNGAVRDFNNRVESVPSNIVASMAGRKVEPYFQLDDAGESAVPQIDFGEDAS